MEILDDGDDSAIVPLLRGRNPGNLLWPARAFISKGQWIGDPEHRGVNSSNWSANLYSDQSAQGQGSLKELKD